MDRTTTLASLVTPHFLHNLLLPIRTVSAIPPAISLTSARYRYHHCLRDGRPPDSPRRFLMKSSIFILRSGLMLGVKRSVLSMMMAKARTKTVSGVFRLDTNSWLHWQ